MELKNYFKIPLKKVNGKTSITEVKYTWADWKEYTWLEFEWYASTSELDRGWDVTLPTAFSDTLKSYMENAMMLLQHDDNKAIWDFPEAQIDSKWLYVKWLVKVDIDHVFQKLRTWVLKTMSIWYRVLDYAIETLEKWWEQVDIFVIKSLELFEISLVSVPMNSWAQIKSLDWLTDQEVKKLYDIEKEDIYTFSKSIEDLSNKVKNFNTNNISMEKTKKVEEETKETEDKPKEIKEEENKVEIKDETPEEKVEETDKNTDKEDKIEEKTIENKESKSIDWEKTAWFKKVKENEENEEDIKTEKKDEEKVEEEENKKTPEKQAWETAGEKKSVVDLKFDKKAFDNLVKESITQIEKTFEEHKKITSKEVKDLFSEQKLLLEKQMDDFAGILVNALKVFEETNKKAQTYISKLENFPISKTYRYQEIIQKPENPLLNLIKQIKR